MTQHASLSPERWSAFSLDQQILMIGNYVLANFTKQADGHGGTLITDPPVQSLTGGVFIPHS